MRKKILIDTNILLDAAMEERPGFAFANLLLEDVACQEVDAYVAAASLKDVYYVLSRYWDEPSARAYIAALADLLGLVAVDEAVCRQAMVSDEPDYEDGIVRVCAEQIGAQIIISRDAKAYSRSLCKKLSAQEYMETYGGVESVAL